MDVTVGGAVAVADRRGEGDAVATAATWLRSARVTLAVIAAMVAVWPLEHALIGTVHHGLVLGYLAFGALPNAPVAGRGSPSQWWRYISLALIHDHQEPLHLTINAAVLLVVAPTAQRLYGKLVLLATLVLGTAAGGAVWVWVSALGLEEVPDHTEGISAGICALLGLLLVFGYRHRTSIGPHAPESIRAQATLGIAVVVLAGLVVPALNNWSHAGGVVAGVVVGLAVSPRQADRRDGDRHVRLVLWAVVAAAVVAVVMAGLNLDHRLA